MDIRLPRLGEGADSGSVVTIFVKEGDFIQKDQNILELENEKAVASIPSPAAGKVTRIHVQRGDRISVGQVLITLAEEGAPPAAAPTRVEKTAPSPSQREETSQTTPPESGLIPKEGVAPVAPPSIRKLARELGIDLTRVRGTERGGRIALADVRAYIQQLQRAALPSKKEAEAALPEQIDFSKWGPVRKVAMTSLRNTISERLVNAWTTIPHVTQFEEVDITDLIGLQKKHAEKYKKKGARLTLTSFAIKAVVGTLKKHPLFNSSLDEVSREIIFKDYFHIGIAVDTEHGLIVPVLKNADQKNLLELSKELEELAERTRERKVSAEELRGGSFTISNQGGIGGGPYTPLINKPEVAILGMGRGALKPAIKEKKIVHSMMLPLSLSYDHRVIDGAAAARFIVDLGHAFTDFSEKDVKI